MSLRLVCRPDTIEYVSLRSLIEVATTGEDDRVERDAKGVDVTLSWRKKQGYAARPARGVDVVDGQVEAVAIVGAVGRDAD